MPATCDYVAHRRTAVYAEPSRAALVGYIPAGTIVRGSMPSSRGWIALDDDDCYVLDDGTLALQSGAPHSAVFDFAKRVELPSDAVLSHATLTQGTGSRAGRWRVVYGPRVAVRSGTHTNATLLGALARGDVIHGTVDDVDPNWLRLSASNMSSGRQPPNLEDGAFTIHVPRLATSQTAAKRPAHSP